MVPVLGEFANLANQAAQQSGYGWRLWAADFVATQKVSIPACSMVNRVVELQGGVGSGVHRIRRRVW